MMKNALINTFNSNEHFVKAYERVDILLQDIKVIVNNDFLTDEEKQEQLENMSTRYFNRVSISKYI